MKAPIVFEGLLVIHRGYDRRYCGNVEVGIAFVIISVCSSHASNFNIIYSPLFAASPLEPKPNKNQTTLSSKPEDSCTWSLQPRIAPKRNPQPRDFEVADYILCVVLGTAEPT